jgi:peroxiredoxin
MRLQSTSVARSEPRLASRMAAWLHLVVVSLTVGSTLAAIALAPTATAAELTDNEAPDFVLGTLEHGNLRLSEYRGQVVLINFWASWCGACRQAMPRFNEIYDKYRLAGLVMLSVNLDDEHHSAMHMAQGLKIKFPVLLDRRKEVSRMYGLDKMPLTVLVDRSGVVRFMHAGFNTGDEHKILEPLRELLNQ